MKRTFELILKVKNCDIEFKRGLGKGVISKENVMFNMDSETMMAMGLIDAEKKLIENIIEVEVNEVG